VSHDVDTLTPEAFVEHSIRTLRQPPFKGIHARLSGFNTRFRRTYGLDPVAFTRRLAEAGVIEIRPARHGVMLYLKGEAPAPKPYPYARSWR
jgi:hypothetical protein